MCKITFESLVSGLSNPGAMYDVLSIIHTPTPDQCTACLELASTLTQALGRPAEWVVINVVAGERITNHNAQTLETIERAIAGIVITAAMDVLVRYNPPDGFGDAGREGYLQIKFGENKTISLSIPAENHTETVKAIVLSLQWRLVQLRLPADYIVAKATYISSFSKE
jgi:hypothetical protein